VNEEDTKETEDKDKEEDEDLGLESLFG